MLCGTRRTALRSAGQEPNADTAVYIADTLGELGLFYRLAPFAFIGGSLVAHGGQNPLEAARLSRAVMAGPHTENFARVYETVFAAQGSGRVRAAGNIASFADRLLSGPGEAQRMGEAAAKAAESLGGALEKTRLAVEEMLTDASA
jgi:3-deoxy-D-manno-octulosonic-acid transferase